MNDVLSRSIFIVILAFFSYLHTVSGNESDSLKPVQIGYFHGGRTVLFYRAYLSDYFEKEGVNIKLLTKELRGKEMRVVANNSDNISKLSYYGKVTGEELIDEIIKGNIDGATVGESSFIAAAVKGAPIVAVALLGHDLKEKPGHAIIFSRDIIIKKPADIKGKVLVSRRGGPGERIFLLEFLRNTGLKESDVKIIDNIPEDELGDKLRNKEIDGGYYHLSALMREVSNGQAYVYRKLNWVNPELSHALLVFRKDFVEAKPEIIEKIVKAYSARIRFERSLSREERSESVKSLQKGKFFQNTYRMSNDFQGMDFPEYEFPPLVSLPLLRRMQALMSQYKIIDKKVDLKQFVDNSFVKKAYEEIK